LVVFDAARVVLHAHFRRRKSGLADAPPGERESVLFGVLEEVDARLGSSAPSHAVMVVGRGAADPETGEHGPDWGVQSACMPLGIVDDLEHCLVVLAELGIPLLRQERSVHCMMEEVLLLADREGIRVVVVTDRILPEAAGGGCMEVVEPLGTKHPPQRDGAASEGERGPDQAHLPGGASLMELTAFEYQPVARDAAASVLERYGAVGHVKIPLQIYGPSECSRPRLARIVTGDCSEEFAFKVICAGRYSLDVRRERGDEGPILLTFLDDFGGLWHLPLIDPEGVVGRAAEEVLSTTHSFGVAYDLMATGRLLRMAGLPNDGIQMDVRMGEHLLDPETGELNLERLAVHRGVPAFSMDGSGDAIPPICAQAAFTISQLDRRLEPRLADEVLRTSLLDVEVPVARLLLEMESLGILVDDGVLAGLGEEMGKERERLDARIREFVRGVDLDRPDAVAHFLSRKLHLPLRRTARTGHPSLELEGLEELKGMHPVVSMLIERSDLVHSAKVARSYRDLLRGRSTRLHTTFDPFGAVTGRISSSSPNLMAVPRRKYWGGRLREAFRAAPGFRMISADYSQIELRVVASLAKDETFLHAFRSGEDCHEAVARELFQGAEGGREMAKTYTFSMLYGAGPAKLARKLCVSAKEARKLRRKWWADYPETRKYKAHLDEVAEEGGAVTTMFGRRVTASGSTKRRAENLLNHVIQGTGVEILKRSMLRVHEELERTGHDARILLPVHDELVLEAAEKEADAVANLVRGAMESAVDLASGLVVKVKTGTTWAECQ
jgi:DNA polymerase I-like protein with 3'-5' exonuclease and polymerase domains